MFGEPASDASTVAAAAMTAHRMLSELFPTLVESYDAQRTTSLEGIPTSPLDSRIEWGTICANDILAPRSNNNSGILVSYSSTNIGTELWNPTMPQYTAVLLPNWPQVIPFTLSSGSFLRPPRAARANEQGIRNGVQ